MSTERVPDLVARGGGPPCCGSKGGVPILGKGGVPPRGIGCPLVARGSPTVWQERPPGPLWQGGKSPSLWQVSEDVEELLGYYNSSFDLHLVNQQLTQTKPYHNTLPP